MTCTRCGTARSKSVYLNHLSVDPEIPPEFSKECLSFSFTAGGSGIPTISDLLEVEMSETVCTNTRKDGAMYLCYSFAVMM